MAEETCGWVARTFRTAADVRKRYDWYHGRMAVCESQATRLVEKLNDSWHSVQIFEPSQSPLARTKSEPICQEAVDSDPSV